jgi:hypothetical protein
MPAVPAPTETNPERSAIVHAMQRLLDGTPLRSDGRLTVVSLAAEANVKRYVLTEKHVDLKDLFYARIRAIDQGTAVSENPPELQRMRDRIAELTRETEQQRLVINALARTVQALQCKLSRANRDGGVSPRPLRPHPVDPDQGDAKRSRQQN